ncbi:unnamed protein product [Paramecium primaurelia]|uniref:Cyclic nucleotide-binding domain-containing protein n=1 Tax=Paramecium primaurelia TaxID=5886 RepID=A0A8S1MB29_PARPR|nr:unnamed protein product [Paramecium primaurelia]
MQNQQSEYQHSTNRNKSQSNKDLNILFLTQQILEKQRSGQISMDDNQLFSHFYQKHPFITSLNQCAETNLLTEYIPYIKYVEIDQNTSVIQNGEYGDLFYGLIQGKININEQCFGIEALNQIPYVQDVKTVQKSKFLIISRSNFQEALQKAKFKERNNLIEFMKESQIFYRMSKRTIASFINFFTLVYFRKNQIIYREGEQADYVYMIREGEFELSKQFDIQNKHKSLPITTIGKPELFGDLDCLMNTSRQYTAKCKEQAYCYKISNLNFYAIIQKNPHCGIENYINSVMRTQTLSRQERLQTASAVLSGNRNLIFGVEEIQKQNKQQEKKFYHNSSPAKITQRFTPIYSNSNRKKIRVRCATLYNEGTVVRCQHKQQGQSDRQEQLIKLKGQLFDEIEIPDRIKRKYQQQLKDLKDQTLRRQLLIIRTQNNQSRIIAQSMIS